MPCALIIKRFADSYQVHSKYSRSGFKKGFERRTHNRLRVNIKKIKIKIDIGGYTGCGVMFLYVPQFLPLILLMLLFTN